MSPVTVVWGHADRGGPLGHGVGVLAYGVDSRPAGSPPRRRWRIRGEKLQERLAKLAGGVAVIKVGAATEVELKVRKHRIEDAVRNAKAAVEEGILPGGGVALVQAGTTVFDKLDLAGDEGTGAHIVQVALEAPLRQIAVNAGLEGGVVADKVKTLPDGHGQDANTGEYVDMLAAGIIDPAKVTRSALQNAASIAGLFLTTEAVVAENPSRRRRPRRREPAWTCDRAGTTRIEARGAGSRAGPTAHARGQRPSHFPTAVTATTGHCATQRGRRRQALNLFEQGEWQWARGG